MAKKVLNILVIEDDQSLLRAHERMFRLRGHNATLVSSGEDAIEAVSKMPLYDAILSDYDIDGYINGGDVYEWIQQKLPSLTKKFILLSSSEIAKRFAQSNGIRFLEKPTGVAQIFEAIRQVG